MKVTFKRVTPIPTPPPQNGAVIELTKDEVDFIQRYAISTGVDNGIRGSSTVSRLVAFIQGDQDRSEG